MMNSCSIHALQVTRVQLFTHLVLEMLAHGNITKNLVVWGHELAFQVKVVVRFEMARIGIKLHALVGNLSEFL